MKTVDEKTIVDKMTAKKAEKEAELMPSHYEIHGKQQLSWQQLIGKIIHNTVVVVGVLFWLLLLIGFVSFFIYCTVEMLLESNRHYHHRNHYLAGTPKHKVALEAHIMYVTQ